MRGKGEQSGAVVSSLLVVKSRVMTGNTKKEENRAKIRVVAGG